VAETDEQARREAKAGIMGRAFQEYFSPLYGTFKILNLLKHDESLPDEAVTLDYMLDHLWMVGNPETVARKIRQFYTEVGGFGTVLMLSYDFGRDKAKWHNSLRLFAREVMPQVRDLEPAH
jgi:alkanesulfonate monooxygenase SsuD/methylene tetrahydromethanopterin reductase-like flavin-dependent oxidoreductase (luciferase family)